MIQKHPAIQALCLVGAMLIAIAGAEPAHAQDSTLLGAGAGAGGGAGIGFALGGPVGAVVGGLVGAGVGAGAGHVIGEEEKRGKGQASYPRGGTDLTAQVQAELNAQGYDAGNADGRYGKRTATAIRTYQYNNGLPQDGQVTVGLLDHLRAKRGAAQQQPAAYQAPPQPGAQPNTQQQGLPALPAAGAQAGASSSQDIDRSNCKPYQQKTMIDGKEMTTQGTACLQRDGSWRTVN